MIFYYNSYDENYLSLLSKINISMLRYSVRNNIECENDILLIHIILNINKTESLYRKKDIKGLIWRELLPRIREVSKHEKLVTGSEKFVDECNDGYEALFEYCWQQKFSLNESGKGMKKIYNILYSNRKWYMKLYDSNYTLVLFLIIFLYIQAHVRDLYWVLEFKEPKFMEDIVFMLGIMYTSLLACYGPPKRLYFWPLICMGLTFLIMILFLFDGVDVDLNYLDLQPDITLAYIKQLCINGLMFLTWYPLLVLNRERLSDCFIM